MNTTTEERPAFAWSEKNWYAESPHCGAKNELDTDACMSSSESHQTCEICRKNFTFRAGK